VQVRRAVSADRAAVCDLVSGVKGHQSLLEDLDVFLQNHRDPVSLSQSEAMTGPELLLL